eukprot:6966969-Prymnesium_polylepis.1
MAHGAVLFMSAPARCNASAKPPMLRHRSARRVDPRAALLWCPELLGVEHDRLPPQAREIGGEAATRALQSAAAAQRCHRR